MKIWQELSRQVARDFARRVADRVARRMSKLPGGLSGDDSGLRTAWLEFCVQVQGEESYFWDAYVETVKQTIAGALLPVRHLDRVAMWLETPAGWDWLAENEDGAALPSVDESDIVEFVFDQVRGLAESSRHPRVVRFLAREDN